MSASILRKMFCLKSAICCQDKLLSYVFRKQNICATSYLSKYSIEKKSDKKLSKLLSGKSAGISKKKKWYENKPTPTFMASSTQESGSKRKVSQKHSQRLEQLNTVIFRNITDLLATGIGGEDILSLHVQISKVKMVSDMSGVNVYWVATGDLERDSQIQTLLDNAAYKLRSALIQQGTLGSLPNLTFLKDLTQSRFLQIEDMLQKADTGYDINSTDSLNDVKVYKPITDKASLQDYINNIKVPLKELVEKELHEAQISDRKDKSCYWISDELQHVDFDEKSVKPTNHGDKISESLGKSEDEDSEVLDLNHADIMSQIITSKLKSKDRSFSQVTDIPEKYYDMNKSGEFNRFVEERKKQKVKYESTDKHLHREMRESRRQYEDGGEDAEIENEIDMDFIDESTHRPK